MRAKDEVWISEYMKKRFRQKAWQKVVSVMICVVVFCTTYALILPAITQERSTFCGMEAHSHSEACYQTVVTEGSTELICQLEETEPHTHTDSCWLPVHTHTEACYTLSEPALSCGQEQAEAHTHTDACYQTAAEPACGLEVQEGHSHGSGCYAETVKTLICTTEESAGHTHGDGCYSAESGELTCTQAESEGHTHADACYQTEGGELICTLEESDGHTHTEACYPEIAICGLSESDGHVHTESCYTVESVLICALGERTEAELGCGVEETEGHTHTEGCYASTEETAETAAVELICQLEEHTHSLICYSDPTADVETAEDWEKTLPSELSGIWTQDVLAVAQSQLGYQESTMNYIVLEDGESVKGYSRYGAWYGSPYGDWCAMFVSFCLHYAGVEDMPLNAGCITWIQALTEVGQYAPAAEHTPQPGDLVFFDWEGDGKSDHVGLVETVTEATDETAAQLTTIEGNSGNRVKRNTYDLTDAVLLGYGWLPHQLTEVEQAEVDKVISLIDEMPSANEIDAKIEEFEEAEDYEGEEAWLTMVYQQVADAYYYYDQLSEVQKAKVTNADKLMELEYIWSITAYTASSGDKPTDTVPIHAVNSYGTVGSGFYSILIYGGSYDEVMEGTANASMQFLSWIAIVITPDADGNLYVEKCVYDSSDKSMLKPSDTTKGFVLLAYNSEYSAIYDFDSKLTNVEGSARIYVSVNFDYSRTGPVYKSTGYGTMSLDTDIFVQKTSEESAAPTPIRSAQTSEFIELNLYDYGSNINTNFNNNKYSYTDWNYATKYTSYYPGFQWNGGAYVKSNLVDSASGTADRNHIDSIDFGNSLITDLDYGGSTHAKSSTATDITFFADSGTYNINAMDYYYKDSNYAVYGVNNRPIGLSIASSITDKSFDVLNRTLGNDGYPTIKANGASLAYLFTNNTYATKQNTTSIDGLFLQDSTTGEYYYNSRWNHAQYSNNKFTLYDEILTPNFITYPFGNFMPFNDITDSEDATQVSKITSMGNYVDYMLDQLYPYTKSSYTAGFDSSRNQLYYMLNQYKSNVKYYDIHEKTWSTFSASDAIWDYFTGGGENEGDSPTDKLDFLTSAHLSSMYNIDYDVEKNFFFGMEMKMNFYQPKDGMTGNDNGSNAKPIDPTTNKREGQPDGMPDYPMEFYFTGDDDVWVYIDDVLFLDLSGIHRHVGGQIDFVNGKVHYYALDISTGDVSSTPYATYTFEQILTAAGASTAGLDSNGRFKDYSTHTFKFYYMERGSGSSVCRLNFNFPMLRQNTISIEKELTADDETIKALGNPDFKFQVLDVDDDGNKTENSFFAQHDDAGSQWAYSLYNVDGSAIQEVKVISRNPDGTVKSMAVYNAEGKVVREETQDDNGKAIITNHPENGEVLTIDENGIFSMKAGQRVEFVGIPETWGQYYVRELLENTLAEQYGTISVSGVVTDPVTVNIGGTAFQGVESPPLDMTNGSSAFRFENKITTAKLGSLSITKNLDVVYSGVTDKKFTFNVTLDGEPLPEGTTYTVVDADGNTVNADVTVTVDKDADGNVTASYVELTAGQTATIENIIAGTAFEVTETTASAKGYTVTYSVDSTDKGANGAAGTVGLDKTVAVVVTNSEIGTSLTIPVVKIMSKYGSMERPYTFNIQEVTDKTGTTSVSGGLNGNETLELGTKPDNVDDRTATFNLSYLLADLEGKLDQNGYGQRIFYYKIWETEGGQYVKYDNSYYIVEVTVTKDSSGMGAQISHVWKYTSDGKMTEVTGETISFTNTILRYLVISKNVSGGGSTTAQFVFKLKLEAGSSGTTVPTTLTGYLNDSSEGAKYTSTDGVFEICLKHGDSLKLVGIPYGCKWTVTEEPMDSYIVSYQVFHDSSTTAAVSGTTNEATGNAGKTTTTVVFTNTITYALPESGGAGTTTYTMAGLVLAIGGAGSLMYNKRKRRKGGKFS